MVLIKVVHPFLGRQLQLRPGDVVLISVDDRPDGFLPEGPAARKHSEMKHWGERLPVPAYQKRSNSAFYGCNTPGRLAIPRSNTVPDAPDIFPALPTNSVEESELQIVRLVAVPAIGDIYHVPGFEPFVTIHSRSERKFILAPR